MLARSSRRARPLVDCESLAEMRRERRSFLSRPWCSWSLRWSTIENTCDSNVENTLLMLRIRVMGNFHTI